MRRYRTEVVIPADRCLTVQLPDSLPTGRAVLIVQAEEFEATLDPDLDEGLDPDLNPDPDDIEWWEEFEDDPSHEPAIASDEDPSHEPAVASDEVAEESPISGSEEPHPNPLPTGEGEG